jgi:glucose-1-phosphatase
MKIKLNEEKISAVVFDLGGVILPICPQNTVDEFISLGLPDFTPFLVSNQKSDYNDFFHAFERGKASEDEFLQWMKSLSASQIADKSIISAWNAMLGCFPMARICLLKKISETCPVYLLSNTNVVHHRAFCSQAQKQGIDSFSSLFSKAYYSQEIGMRKPDAEIFVFVASELGIDPAEILFLDDNLPNIEAARQCGYRVRHVEKNGEICNYDWF